eukprot:TRINITY_DN5037_c0_g1_i15.p1 TRINITY_DN5037_c0_g1~~TRINITY_DN5037_c0_g1_i15.p1  ORF type:complete len:240 (-),score=59.15 TRINITY_DN5037_c0_g1_i15:189-908(-)
MKVVANVINDAVNAAENQAKCLSIERQFGGSVQIVEAHRKFIKEGILLKQCRKERKERRFFLFSDILIYGFDDPSHLTGQDIILSQQLKLESTSVEDVPDSLLGMETLENTLLIKAPGKSFYVFTSSLKEKQEWFSVLQKTIQEEVDRLCSFQITKDRGTSVNTAPIWTPDFVVDYCPSCKEKFGFYVRKHHCRSCGKIICGPCSRNKILLPHINMNAKERVCDTCFLIHREKEKQLNT